MGARFALLLFCLATGCALGPRHDRSAADAVLVESVLTSAAVQVRRCYRAPRVSSEGRLIVTQLRVRVFPGGDVRGLPVVLGQSGITRANQSYARPMAEAAIGAVVRCAPLSLPSEVYLHGWVDIYLTFSPLARV